MTSPRTGYEIREGSAMLADRIAAALADPPALDVCDCGETRYRGRCYNVGACRLADVSASRQSLARGTAASARPAAWTLGGRVD